MTRARELANLAGVSETALSNRNFILNGSMQVAQRSTATVTANNTYNTLDRWIFYSGTDGAYTTEQSSTAPAGFSNSLKATVTTADTSIGAAQYAYFLQSIEGQNLQNLEYGLSTAKNITLSFWVRSSKVGTYCITMEKHDNTRYHFVKEYTINSANTWEKKEITISPTAGSTSFITSSGGAMGSDNTLGARIDFWLAAGSNNTTGVIDNAWSSDTNDYATPNQVNWMDSISNDFYLTGIQLEVGEQATPFEHRSYGDELALCQRYTYVFNSEKLGGEKAISSMSKWSNGYTYGAYNFPCTMRTAPSGTAFNLNQFTIYIGGGAGAPNTEVNIENVSPVSCEMNVQTSLGSTGQSGFFRKTGNSTGSSAGYIVFDAEL